MDNVCHTLVGVAAARAGLNRKTAFATATLAIASNLPDIDVLAWASDVPVVALRRGWTHGILAQALLPIGFAGLVYLLGRRRQSPVHFGWLLTLSYIGVLGHVFLDYLNNYGIRLLMPFSGRWFYGDTVFIVDVWLWLLLGIGSLAARRGRRWPARTGLALATVYVAAMLVSARAARGIVEERWIQATGAPPASLMVGPTPIDPLRKSIIVDAGDRYVTGTFTWYPRRIAFDRAEVPKNHRVPWVGTAAAREPDFNALLVWTRFPYWTFEKDAQGVRVTLRDMRFRHGRAGFGATTYIEAR